MLLVTRHCEFEAAHMLSGYDGGCGSLHGHSYKLELTISCPEDVRNRRRFGFVLDFKHLDNLIKNNIPDHMFMYNKNSPTTSVEYQIATLLKNNNLRVWEFDNAPSAENMCKELAINFQRIFDENYLDLKLNVVELKLWETANSFATWRKE